MSTAEEQVDLVIQEFDEWFQRKENDPLIGPERAILKTFCYFLMTRQNTTALPVIEQENVDASSPGS